MDVFSKIDRSLPIIIAEAVWQYSHHILPGLISHQGPILTLANWSGKWPGLVGMLNLNGSLTKAGVAYSSLWSEDFLGDAHFKYQLNRWIEYGIIEHDTSHVSHYTESKYLSESVLASINSIVEKMDRKKCIIGVFDEFCMGMYNAVIPDELLFEIGVYKERLSQSALYAEMETISDTEAEDIFDWINKRGFNFHFGSNPNTELTKSQVLDQCKMYIAACRIGAHFGCDAIGIQYQQGLKDLCPASDLVEGMLNSSDCPPVKDSLGNIIFQGEPFTHFNEVDECAGLDALITKYLHKALGQPLKLHYTI